MALPFGEIRGQESQTDRLPLISMTRRARGRLVLGAAGTLSGGTTRSLMAREHGIGIISSSTAGGAEGPSPDGEGRSLITQGGNPIIKVAIRAR